MQTIVALYTPKSLTVTKEGEGYRVRVKAKSPVDIAGAIVLVFLSFFVFPLSAFLIGAMSILLIIGSLAFALYLVLRHSPDMKIDPEGVTVRNHFLTIKDIAGFSDKPNDKWGMILPRLIGADILGARYGIYTVSLPYLLPVVELPLVIIHLNHLLESLDREIGEERELKIQQSQKF